MSFRGLVVGVSGLKSQAKKMEVIGNNLSNIGTTGFKKGQVSFHELYNEVVKGASAGDGGSVGGTNPSTIGNGVGISSINNVFTQGTRQQTARTLDFMIEGDDFFVSKSASSEELMLTRNGAFQLDGDLYLTDSFGNKVQGFNVDPNTQSISQVAGNIQLSDGSIAPNATTEIRMESNIDSSVTETLASLDTSAFELFSAGENFGGMSISAGGASGSRATYGSGYYQESILYSDSAASINAVLDTVTLSSSPENLVEGFSVGDSVSLLQGSEQVKRTITAVDSTTREITLSGAAPSDFSSGTLTITNLTDGYSARGSSGSSSVHNDLVKSQIAMVDDDGNILASFNRVSGPASDYTRATATQVDGTEVTIGTGEFTNMQELKENIELALRDSQLSNYEASSDLAVSLDKFGKITFGGTGLVQEFRLVMNADNTEMLDRFDGIAITDAATTATTQARVDADGKIINSGSLGSLGARSTNASKQWFTASGLQNYGYDANNQATEYGEFAGLRLDGGADGNSFGVVELSLVNGLGETVTQEYRLVARNADSNQNEFTTIGELATLVQNTLRGASFSSIAEDGSLAADTTASANFNNGRLSVSTSSGSFNNLTISAVNDYAPTDLGIARSDDMNFGTVLGQLSQGVSGKSGISNRFIEADVVSNTQVFDSQGNEHTVRSYFVRDRSAGLSNIEWKYKMGLNPNINTFASENTEDDSVYAATFNSVQDTADTRGVLAFDIDSGMVLGSNSAGSDPRYDSAANISFLPQSNSQEADTSSVEVDFTNMTSYNGSHTVIGINVDGYAMGNLVRITSEENTGNINGVYTNGKVRTLAKLGLMSIANPEGLQKVGSSYYSQTTNSSEGGNPKGLDQVYVVGEQSNTSGDSVTSKIHGNSLEASNVDLTEELTEMITTQRSYSASGRIITTTDDMIQEALSLKR